MASPDITPYVDLRLLDRNAQTIFEQSLALLYERLPGIVLREASTEIVLLEGQSLIADELTFAVNRLPGAITEVVLRLYGVERDIGERAVGQATVTVINGNGHVIPLGTVFRADIGGGEFVLFNTTEAVAVSVGQTTGTVTIESQERTVLANDIPVGTLLTLITPVTSVESAVVSTTPTGARDEELPTNYLNRGVQVLRRLVTTLVTPANFEAAVLADARAFRVKAIDLYNANAGSGVPGDHPGYLAIAVLGPDGNVLSPEAKADLQSTLSSQAQANLHIDIIDPEITVVPITVEVFATPGFDAADVEANIESVLAQYLSPLSWSWSGVVRRNELIALIDRVSGVDYVVSLDAPAADVTLTGVANLVEVGATTITVVTPP